MGGWEVNGGGRRKKHIWWRFGVTGTSTPSGRRRRSAHNPAHTTTTGALMVPAVVRTPVIRLPSASRASTATYWTMVAPSSRARLTSALVVDDGSA
jgi:hypothetical protein